MLDHWPLGSGFNILTCTEVLHNAQCLIEANTMPALQYVNNKMSCGPIGQIFAADTPQQAVHPTVIEFRFTNQCQRMAHTS